MASEKDLKFLFSKMSTSVKMVTTVLRSILYVERAKEPCGFVFSCYEQLVHLSWLLQPCEQHRKLLHQWDITASPHAAELVMYELDGLSVIIFAYPTIVFFNMYAYLSHLKVQHKGNFCSFHLEKIVNETNDTQWHYMMRQGLLYSSSFHRWPLSCCVTEINKINKSPFDPICEGIFFLCLCNNKLWHPPNPPTSKSSASNPACSQALCKISLPTEQMLVWRRTRIL